MVKLLGSAFVFAAALVAQTPSAITDVGYVINYIPLVARGQVVTLTVQGLTAPDGQPAQFPLPLVLNGVRVAISNPGTGYRKDVPILRVQTIPCGIGAAGILVCDRRAVTIQIPYDSPLGNSTITIHEKNVAGYSSEFLIGLINPSVLDSCFFFLTPTMDPCAGQKMITHADGTLVSKARPALLGETLVLYLLGLGATDIYVPEGQAAPANPAKVAISMQASVGNTPVGAPFAGLVPGLAGLYQVNIPLPSNPVPTFTSIDGLAVSLKIEAPGFALSTFVPAGW